MDKSKILDWKARGTAPSNALLSGGYNPLDTPDASHWNEMLYSLFQSLREVADESNDAQKKTNFSLDGGNVNLSYANVPRFVSMSGGNSSIAEGNVGTQTVSEDFARGRLVVSDSTSPASPVAFKGVVTAMDGYKIEWLTTDTSLSVPYTVAFDVMKENIDLTSLTVEPATVSQPFTVENFKVLSIAQNANYVRVAFTFQLRKTESSNLTSTTLTNFVLKVGTSAVGSRTAIGVSGMTLVRGSVAPAFIPNATDTASPKALSLANISLASYIGKSATFSVVLGSNSSSLGLSAGNYYGFHVKPPKSMMSSGSNTSNMQLISDGSQLYFRVFEDSAVGSTAFKKSPTMDDVAVVLGVYAKTTEVNNAITNALTDYYTKAQADIAFMNSTKTGTAIDAKIATYDTTLWKIVGPEGYPKIVMTTGTDFFGLINGKSEGTYLVMNMSGVSVVNSPWSTTVDGTSNLPFIALVVKANNKLSGIAWGASTYPNQRSATIYADTTTKNTLWTQTATTTFVQDKVNLVNNDLSTREALVWQGSLTAVNATATVSKFRVDQSNSPSLKAVEPAWVTFIVDAYNGNRFTYRCPWKPNGYTTEPTGNFGINTTNIVDSPTYDTDGTTVISENIYMVEMRINMVQNPSNSNQFVIKILSNDHAPINTATKNIGKVSRDSGNITIKGIIFEYDTQNYTP